MDGGALTTSFKNTFLKMCSIMELRFEEQEIFVPRVFETPVETALFLGFPGPKT